MREYAVFSPGGADRMLTHGGSVAHVCLRADHGYLINWPGGDGDYLHQWANGERCVGLGFAAGGQD
jgi:hypothetical protein